MAETLLLIGVSGLWLAGELLLASLISTPGRYLAAMRLAVVLAIGVGICSLSRT